MPDNAQIMVNWRGVAELRDERTFERIFLAVPGPGPLVVQTHERII